MCGKWSCEQKERIGHKRKEHNTWPEKKCDIHIDDERLHVLTKNRKTKTGIDFSESDHNLIHTKFNLTWSSKKAKVTEVFKYNDKHSKDKFKQVTTNTKHLSQIIDMNKPLDVVINKFLKRLKGFIHECFQKVKIVDRPDTVLESLYNKRRILRNKKDTHSKSELEKVEIELSEKYSDAMSKKIFNEVKGLEDAEEGGFNAGKLWKMKKKTQSKR